MPTYISLLRFTQQGVETIKDGELALENDFLERALGKAGLLSAKR